MILIELLKCGGFIMLPIFACAIVATFIIIERMCFFFSVRQRDTKLFKEIEGSLDMFDFSTVEACCVKADTPCASVVRTAVQCRSNDIDVIREEVQASMNDAAVLFEKFLTPLGTIANISTLLGLLGTVIGNIKAFGLVGAGATMGNPAVLASSISEALITTAAGLCVSIPTVIFHNYFVTLSNRRIGDMESNVTRILLKLTGRNL